MTEPTHDYLLDPVDDPVLDPVADPALDPTSDPSAMPAVDAEDIDPLVVEAVVDIRNRFGVRGLRDLARLAEAEIVTAERAIRQLDPGT